MINVRGRTVNHLVVIGGKVTRNMTPTTPVTAESRSKAARASPGDENMLHKRDRPQTRAYIHTTNQADDARQDE